MTSSAPTNPSPPVPVPVPVPTPPPTANGAASSPKDQPPPPPPPPPPQQQQAGGQEESAAAADGGGGAEAAEAGVVAGAAGEAMEVDGGPGAGDAEAGGTAGGGGGGGGGTGGGAQQASPATVFRIRLKQSPASLRHKMRVPELCRNFSSNSSPPFWIPIHILNPERPTECSVFNVKADSPRDFVQFIEWSPRSCPRALLVANFHGRITIWTQPNKGPVNLVRDASSWQCEHEWRQDLSVVTKWLSGTSPYRWLPANSTSSNLKTFEEKFLSQQPQSSVSLNSVIAFLDADFHSLPTMQQRQQHCPVSVGYVDAVLDLASHFITRLRRYASFCRTLASHVGPSSTTSTSRSMVTSPTNSSPSLSNNQGNPGGATSATGNSQMQEWVQGAIAKISNNSDGAATATPNPMSGRSRQAPRLLANAQKNQDSAIHKIQHMMNAKTEDNTATVRSGLGAAKVEDGQATRGGQFALGAKGPEENSIGKSVRIGSGNAGQGYTSDEVKVLFLILVDLCRRTSTLPHPLPASQVGSNNIIIRLHYIDGNYTVLPEVVEASLGPHMQNMPRPRGADAAGLLLRELELQPPAEEWHRRNMFGGPWSEPDDFGPLDNMLHKKFSGSINPLLSDMEEDHGNSLGIQSLWPRKRRLSERDAAFGLKTSVGLGGYLGVMGSRRDVITAVWRTGLDGEWYKVSMLKAAFNSGHFKVL
nr:unnamed protein product [Digitaria exilis]